MIVLTEAKYLDDGISLWRCESCKGELKTALALWWYDITDLPPMTPRPIPDNFPLKYCWNCGQKATHFAKP